MFDGPYGCQIVRETDQQDPFQADTPRQAKHLAKCPLGESTPPGGRCDPIPDVAQNVHALRGPMTQGYAPDDVTAINNPSVRALLATYLWLRSLSGDPSDERRESLARADLIGGKQAETVLVRTHAPLIVRLEPLPVQLGQRVNDARHCFTLPGGGALLNRRRSGASLVKTGGHRHGSASVDRMVMHDDELHIDEEIARRLIAEQFPALRHHPVRQMVTEGTVNAIFRVGPDLTARFPLRSADLTAIRAQLSREAAAMRELAGCCPFPAPMPVAEGSPGRSYPLPWSVQTWVPGSAATPSGLARSGIFAHDLAILIHSLRSADTRGRSFAGAGRGGNLQDSDRWMDVCFRESEGLLPVERLRTLWARFRTLPPAGPDVMSHSDLIPGNLLVEGDRLVGVLDGGGFVPADMSLDLVAAWHMLDAERRASLRGELGCTDLEWWRGAAWAFQQAMGLVWYYRTSNPGMSALGRSTLARILNDPEISSLAQ